MQDACSAMLTHCSGAGASRRLRVSRPVKYAGSELPRHTETTAIGVLGPLRCNRPLLSDRKEVELATLRLGTAGRLARCTEATIRTPSLAMQPAEQDRAPIEAEAGHSGN